MSDHIRIVDVLVRHIGLYDEPMLQSDLPAFVCEAGHPGFSGFRVVESQFYLFRSPEATNLAGPNQEMTTVEERHHNMVFGGSQTRIW